MDAKVIEAIKSICEAQKNINNVREKYFKLKCSVEPIIKATYYGPRSLKGKSYTNPNLDKLMKKNNNFIAYYKKHFNRYM